MTEADKEKSDDQRGDITENVSMLMRMNLPSLSLEEVINGFLSTGRNSFT